MTSPPDHNEVKPVRVLANIHGNQFYVPWKTLPEPWNKYTKIEGIHVIEVEIRPITAKAAGEEVDNPDCPNCGNRTYLQDNKIIFCHTCTQNDLQSKREELQDIRQKLDKYQQYLADIYGVKESVINDNLSLQSRLDRARALVREYLQSVHEKLCLLQLDVIREGGSATEIRYTFELTKAKFEQLRDEFKTISSLGDKQEPTYGGFWICGFGKSHINSDNCDCEKQVVKESFTPDIHCAACGSWSHMSGQCPEIKKPEAKEASVKTESSELFERINKALTCHYCGAIGAHFCTGKKQELTAKSHISYDKLDSVSYMEQNEILSTSQKVPMKSEGEVSVDIEFIGYWLDQAQKCQEGKMSCMKLAQNILAAMAKGSK